MRLSENVLTSFRFWGSVDHGILNYGVWITVQEKHVIFCHCKHDSYFVQKRNFFLNDNIW